MQGDVDAGFSRGDDELAKGASCKGIGTHSKARTDMACIQVFDVAEDIFGEAPIGFSARGQDEVRERQARSLNKFSNILPGGVVSHLGNHLGEDTTTHFARLGTGAHRGGHHHGAKGQTNSNRRHLDRSREDKRNPLEQR